MYIGIYISDSYISVATINQDGEVDFIRDESISTDYNFLTPLKLYVEDNYAYLGNPVDSLIASDYNLNYTDKLFRDEQDSKAVIYEDASGKSWHIDGLLAIYLKKVKTDIHIYNGRTIKGAILTIDKPLSPEINEIIKKAFALANIPFCGTIDFCKAAIRGYDIKSTGNTSATTLICNLEKTQLTIGVTSIAEDQYANTLGFETVKILGDDQVFNTIGLFLIERYEAIAQLKIKQNSKTKLALKHITTKVYDAFFAEPTRLFYKVICAFEGPFLELLVTRSQIENILLGHQKTITEAVETVLKSTKIKSIDYLLITGTSRLTERIETSLIQVCKNEKVAIYNSNQNQIITHGVAQYANSTIDREISLSLLKEYEESTKIIVQDSDPENTEIEGLYINAGCDI